jgi:hypothetical protein
MNNRARLGKWPANIRSGSLPSGPSSNLRRPADNAIEFQLPTSRLLITGLARFPEARFWMTSEQPTIWELGCSVNTTAVVGSNRASAVYSV